MEKVTAYVTRRRETPQLLVLRDRGHADVGLVVPGGAMRAEESPVDAVARELREESGLDSLGSWRPLGSIRYSDAEGRAVERHYFHGLVQGDLSGRLDARDTERR